MQSSITAAVLSVRVSPAERVVLESAAAQARTTLSDFIRRKAIEAAETELLERGLVTIPASDWARFENWVDSPAKSVPALHALATRKPVWQD